MKQIVFFFLFISAIAGVASCKQQAIMVNPGAVVSREGKAADAEKDVNGGDKDTASGDKDTKKTDEGLRYTRTRFSNAQRTDEGIQITFSSDLLFPTNSSYLTEAAKEELHRLAEMLNTAPNRKIRVDGHTDATGEAKYNQWLSEKRAASVERFLVNAGVSASRILTKGLGQTKPVADNKTPEGRQKNRRVEVVVLD